MNEITAISKTNGFGLAVTLRGKLTLSNLLAMSKRQIDEYEDLNSLETTVKETLMPSYVFDKTLQNEQVFIKQKQKQTWLNYTQRKMIQLPHIVSWNEYPELAGHQIERFRFKSPKVRYVGLLNEDRAKMDRMGIRKGKLFLR